MTSHPRPPAALAPSTRQGNVALVLDGNNALAVDLAGACYVLDERGLTCLTRDDFAGKDASPAAKGRLVAALLDVAVSPAQP